MGSNISNNTKRANISARHLGDFLDWRFYLTCPRCREQRTVTAMMLSAQLGGQIKVGEVVNRFRCSIPNCGTAPSIVIMANRKHRVVLVGPGAFS